MMARILLILTGMILGAIGACTFLWLAGWAYGPLYTNEDEMSRNVKVFLIIAGVGIVAGGWGGCRVSKHHAKKRVNFGHRES